ncbi:MAG: electron transport complex subunit RsxB [Pseudomonadota bacterium]|nr:electron transport complex subunit RsxB [Pseudomonadota bacterium]
MWISVLIITLLAAVAGLALGYANARLPADDASLAQQIDQLLPQTQCGQCGFVGCRPYAQAIANGLVDINRCPPGGDATVSALAQLLGRENKPLADDLEPATPGLVALIDETQCIGCARCLPPCPVDAIIGAPQQMHTVIADHCTGCGLCLPACPVDCIDLIQTPKTDAFALGLSQSIQPAAVRG